MSSSVVIAKPRSKSCGPNARLMSRPHARAVAEHRRPGCSPCLLRIATGVPWRDRAAAAAVAPRQEIVLRVARTSLLLSCLRRPRQRGASFFVQLNQDNVFIVQWAGFVKSQHREQRPATRSSALGPGGAGAIDRASTSQRWQRPELRQQPRNGEPASPVWDR